MEKVTNNSGSDTNGNYCKMPDGTLIQWGTITIGSSSYTRTVSFPMSFVDANAKVSLTPTVTGTDFNVNSVSKTGLDVGRAPLGANNVYHYIAIGRWK